jgi:hypothetical protein
MTTLQLCFAVIMIGALFGLTNYDENIKDKNPIRMAKAIGVAVLFGSVFLSWFFIIHAMEL